MVIIHRNNELKHYGVPGTHWGIRNYQNKDGSYKPGAEGRYYTPVKTRKINGPKYNISVKGGGGTSAGKKSSDPRSLMKMTYKTGKSSSSSSGGGGGGSSKKAVDKSDQPNAKTRTGRDIHIYDVSEKLETKEEKKAREKAEKEAKKAAKKSGGGKGSGKAAGKGSGKGESSSEKETSKTQEMKKEAAFKISHLYDKISDLFGSDELTQEDWNNTKLSEKDIMAIDELIEKYRAYKSADSSETKQTKKIDAFIEQYETWKRKNKKNVKRSSSDENVQRQLFVSGKNETGDEKRLKHSGIPGTRRGVQRFRNPDGTLSDCIIIRT